jgi:uncharacterized protein (DUF1684 family)
VRPTKLLFFFSTGTLVLWTACQTLSGQTGNEPAYLAKITEFRQARDLRLRTCPFSPLALVNRKYLKESTRLTLGSSSEADLRLVGEEIEPLHAVVERNATGWRLQPVRGAVVRALNSSSPPLSESALKDNTGFRIGRFNLRYIDHAVWGPTLEAYDSGHAALREFTGLDYYPVDAAYRVVGEVVPYPSPRQLDLIDSHGNRRPYLLFGQLHFELRETPCRLELYSTSTEAEEIERVGFMLMFTDTTSGKESYPAARYLDVEGKISGKIVVDFNQAYSPPCSFSPVYTCPFPRPQNRLPVAVEAGEKWYRKQSAESNVGQPGEAVATRGPESAVAEDTTGLRYAVQVGAHEDAAAALAQAKQLTARYQYTALVAPVEVRGKTYYRVRIRVRTREEAEALAARLRQQEHLETWVVKAD